MTILVIADHNHTQLKDATRHTLTAALQLKDSIHILVAGVACDKAALEAAQLEGVTEVIQVDHECYRNFLSESYSRLIAKLAPSYTHILASGSSIAKDVLPRAAGLSDSSQVSDIISIIDHETFLRPIYAGNAIATVRSHEKIKFITVRATAFPLAALSSKEAPITKRTETDTNQKSLFVSAELSASTRPELTSAKIIVSGGRGLGSADNFKTVLEPLADKLKAAVGASRAAVDAGFVPNDYQVGQTGKIVAPELYIAVGISGAIQHMAGMKDSKVIVAINKDPDAPIFQFATYGLVADLFEAIPELVKSL